MRFIINIFNADIRKSNADLRGYFEETICDHLRVIRGNPRSENAKSRTESK
ncbi:MAG: hypothetical protein ABH954_00540 [Candidatus Omnitrophota bacterium]